MKRRIGISEMKSIAETAQIYRNKGVSTAKSGQAQKQKALFREPERMGKYDLQRMQPSRLQRWRRRLASIRRARDCQKGKVRQIHPLLHGHAKRQKRLETV